MTFSIVFRRAAKVEFEKAAVWYDEQRTGLGEEFIVEIEQAIANAAAGPCGINSFSGIYAARLRGAFRIPCTFESVQTNWLSSQYFTVVGIRRSGSYGYNSRWNGRTKTTRRSPRR